MRIVSELLLKDEAYITSQGIFMNGAYYTCHLAIKERWFEQALSNCPWVLPAYQDPIDLDFALLQLHDGRLVLASKVGLAQDEAIQSHAASEEYQRIIRMLKLLYRRRKRSRRGTRCYYL